MYHSPPQFEPLLLSARQLEEVAPACGRVVMASVKLTSAAHESTRASLRERNARSLLSQLLAAGLVVSDSAYGPVRFGLPLDSLSMLFPNLYPEADLPLD